MESEPLVIGAQKYRIVGRMNAMEQFHVTRRLGPALVICGIGFKMLAMGMKVSIDQWASIAGPVMEVVSKMTDEDVEYVILHCMKTCQRMSGGMWAPVTTPDGKQIMFADMDQAELLRLTIEVLRMNLENFAKGMFDGENSPNDSAGTTHP